MKFRVQSSNSNPPIETIVCTLHEAGISIAGLEVSGEAVFLRASARRAGAGVEPEKILSQVPGVSRVDRIEMLPSEVQNLVLAAIWDTAHDPQFGVDLCGRVTAANDATRCLFGEQVVGTDISELLRNQALRKELITTCFGSSRRELVLDKVRYILESQSIKTEANGSQIIVGGILTLRTPIGIEQPHQNREDSSFASVIGSCPQIKSLLDLAAKFARSDAPLIIRGETGTGKELIAQACHKASARRSAAFLALNCAAMPESLAESELFGYAPGSFSGASRHGKAGLLELADNGTLFLDEIGEMAPHLQAKLLRFLNDGSFLRVGAGHEVRVDVRIISATHRNLEEMVRKGEFREDLFYRLNVLDLTVPPLRDRKEDIVLLANQFLKEACEKDHRPLCRFSTGALVALSQHPWPGNVRHLRNVITRAVAASDGEMISSAALFVQPAGPREAAPAAAPPPFPTDCDSLAEAVMTFEKSMLESLYAHFPSSRLLATRLKVSHTTVATKLRKHGIGLSPNRPS